MRPWKMDRCQWSAKRQKFMHGRFPHCVKVIERSELEEISSLGQFQFDEEDEVNGPSTTEADQQLLDEEYDESIDQDISVVVDDTLEGKLGLIR